MMMYRLLPKTRKTAAVLAAAVLAAALPAGGPAVYGDEIVLDDGSEDIDAPVEMEDAYADPEEPAPEDSDDSSGDLLIEDVGEVLAVADGIMMEDVREMESETELSNEEPELELIPAEPERITQSLQALCAAEDPTGSDGELLISAYIEKAMKDLGFTIEEQAFHEGVLNELGIDAPGINILAERGANSEENRTRDIILVVTHYDSKTAYEDGDPFANDKTGAAVLLETARILASVESDSDICFLFLSGQEDGGFGAANFIRSLSEENRSRVSDVLVVDRLGYDIDTPFVLRTLTGEGNELGYLLQEAGIAADAEAAAEEISEADSAETEDTAAGSAETEDTAADDPAAESFPSPWSYLKDEVSTHSGFSALFRTVGVSQYIPDLDGDLYEETKELGLADTTEEAYAEALEEALSEYRLEGIEMTDETGTAAEAAAEEAIDAALTLAGADMEITETETETETEETVPSPAPDPVRLARAADIIASVLAEMMQPAE